MHTPGPWQVSPTKYRTLINAVSGAPVAACDDLSPADARLIAAAPELLAALQAMLARHDDRDASDMWPAEAKQARAAIAKATGV